MMRLIVLCTLLLIAPLCAASGEADVHTLIEQAHAAAGSSDPAHALQALLDAIPRMHDINQRSLISEVAELGRHDGFSPAPVNGYLQQQAPPMLLDVAKSQADWSTRGAALLALRNLNAPDDVLDRGIAIADADDTPFVRNQGTALRRWKLDRPTPADTAATIKPANSDAERRAIAMLKQRRIGVSAQQLTQSALDGSAEEVEALLAAGVRATVAPAHGESAIWQVFHGCSGERATADARIRILRTLLAHGADINVHDENNNVPLMIAAKSCPLPVVRAAVEAGAKVNRVNAHNMSPLGWAFLMNKWDMAAYLVGQGARLKTSERDGIFSKMPTDADKLDLIRRATAK